MALAAAGAALAEDGDLDPAFGTGGIVAGDLGRADNPAFAATLDAADGILVVGSLLDGRDRDAFVARYTPDGSLDPSFGTDGVATVAWGPSGRRITADDFAAAVAVDPEGRVIIGGWSLRRGGPRDASPMLALARLDASGALDPTFGRGGRVATTVRGSINDLAVDTDGTIVVGGSTGEDIVLARFAADGSPVRGFGRRGVLRDDWGTPQEFVGGIDLDEQGRILAAGIALDANPPPRWGLRVARYLPDGTPDTTFGEDGRTTLDLDHGSKAQDVIIVEGQPLVAGDVDGEDGRPVAILLLRLAEDGSPDPAFGTDGVAQLTVADVAYLGANAVSTAPDGAIVVTGFAGDGVMDQPLVARFMPDGTVDPTFGSDGATVIELPGSAFGLDVMVQPSGRIVSGGRVIEPTGETHTDLLFLAGLTAAPPESEPEP
jgi:uncharacterized delta-60 repeat protein